MRIFSFIFKSELLFVCLVLSIGFYFRIIGFPHVPEFTDEVRESLLAYDIYTFSYFPITNFSAYIGSIYLYMLAIFMWITPLSIWTPRNFVFLLGVVTIAVTYQLGKKCGNKSTGIVAAMYVATSPTLALINSRIAWSNCVTPLFTVLTLLALNNFISKLIYRNIVILGLIIGITMQLHPLMIIALVPVVLFSLIKLSARVYLQAIKRFLIFGLSIAIGIAPLIIVNIYNPGISIGDAIEKNHFNVNNIYSSPAIYISNLHRELTMVRHLVKHSIIFEGFVIPGLKYNSFVSVSSIDDTIFILLIFGAGISIYKASKNSMIFMSFLTIFFFLISAPFITTDYFEGLKVRYYSFLIPLFGLAIAFGYNFIASFIHPKPRFLILACLSLLFIYIAQRNINAFLLLYKDPVSPVQKEIQILRDFKNRQYDIYYLSPTSNEIEVTYSFTEFLIKFSGIEAYKIMNQRDIIHPILQRERIVFVLPRSDRFKQSDEVYGDIKSQTALFFEGSYFEVYTR